ncbi:lipopolysaccharide biosynthesis protein [Dysgonomonas sp. 25]|uniref:lipopolysaccharide biosynthesis protein n=1 Tax=Dysgonomonas sp. 25 TaxID=2302933 RepID=UPI0013D689CB|nr:lipopolysaccharide biosynthesis protein [Dysgonomonas sp. 25]NDV69141.1 lipopolysaccharide biosynthesis protein [Dysgonomonas sp. 25]
MTDNLKHKTGIAFFWSLIDKGGQQFIQLLIMFVMARLVEPDEMGTVAVLSIFSAIASIMQESGFSSVLIRRKEAIPSEQSSVFYFNISVSLLIYLIFFFSAPLLGWFYEKPVLTNLSRFVFLAFVFNAFGIIQNINLVRTLNFKTNTRITLIAGIISGIVAIILACFGLKVWAIASQIVVLSFVRNVLLWVFVRWKPIPQFRLSDLRGMYSYSAKLMATNILNQICGNIYPTIISKLFGFSQAGYYSQAKKFNDIPQVVISDGIKNVALPMLSQVNEDHERRKRAFRKIMRITGFISFPVTMILILLAEPIIIFALSDKWVGVIPLLQILAAGAVLYPLHTMTSPLLQALGKSQMILTLAACQNFGILASILLSVHWGVEGLIWGLSAVNMLFYSIELIVVGRKIGYTAKELFVDIIPFLGIAFIAFAPTALIPYLLPDIHIYLAGILQLLAGGILYLLIIKLSGAVILQEAIDFAKRFTKRGKEKEA